MTQIDEYSDEYKSGPKTTGVGGDRRSWKYVEGIIAKSRNIFSSATYLESIVKLSKHTMAYFRINIPKHM